MTLAIVLIVIILLILAVLVVLLVDVLVNDSDAVINAPGAGTESGVNPGDREYDNAAPRLSQPVVERTQQTELPKTAPVVLTQEDAEKRIARMMRDPELRNIPPLLFPNPDPWRPEDNVKYLLPPRQPMPLLIPPEREGSMVEQIDEILQRYIAGTPLEHREVRLIESTTRGVVVKVGPLYFDGVDAVTDPEVKAAVRAAVAEWEAGQ